MERLKKFAKSEIKYGYLAIPKGIIRSLLPQNGEPIIVKDSDNIEHHLTMHNSQPGRIDGLTHLYKDFQVQEGDYIGVEMLAENVIKVSFYKLTLRRKKH